MWDKIINDTGGDKGRILPQSLLLQCTQDSPTDDENQGKFSVFLPKTLNEGLEYEICPTISKESSTRKQLKQYNRNLHIKSKPKESNGNLQH